jgi:hypothetical protein
MWFGLIIMLAMIGGLIWWGVWAYRKSDRGRKCRNNFPLLGDVPTFVTFSLALPVPFVELRLDEAS